MIAELLILFWRHATPAEIGTSAVHDPVAARNREVLISRASVGILLFAALGANMPGTGVCHIALTYSTATTRSAPDDFSISRAPWRASNSWSYQYQPTRRTALLRVAGVTHTLSAPDTGDGTTPPPSCEFETPKRETTVEAWSLWRYRGAWPRAYLTDNVIRAPEGQQLELLAKLAANDFDLQRHPVVALPNAFQGIESHAPTTQRIMPGEITHWSRTVNRVSLDMTLHKSAVLVYSENNYPGWKAYITAAQNHVWHR